MCGIIGYTGRGNAAKTVYEGLENLEYRGYDSAGVALLSDGRLKVFKRAGRVQKLQDMLAGEFSHIGIGHTRWATHGKPSDVNAHPHVAGGIAIVHNGIIENYSELKYALIDRGVNFLSETDSEVIAALMKENYSGDILKALSKTVKLLKGSYAIMAICENEQAIAVAKHKSPVILGYGKGETFCASDEPALAGKCEYISVLKDGDIALLKADSVDIFDFDLNPVIREKLPNTAKTESLELGGCPHYMLKELRSSPATVKNTLSAFQEVRDGIKAIVDDTDRVIFIGCGTAYHAGLIGKFYMEELAKMPAEAETAGEFRYKNPFITPKTLVVAVSQSGETADTLEGAELALKFGAKVVAVTNSPHSRLTRIATAVLPVVAGAEICVAATKSYIGQIVALRCLAQAFAGGDFDPSLRADEISKLCEKTIENIDLYSLAHLCARSRGVYFLGRGIDYAVAVEGSLKLKEVSYIFSEGYPAGELKHGTLALIDGNAVCVFIATDERLADKCANAVEQVLSRGGIAAIITHIAGLKEKFYGRAQIVNIPEAGYNLSPVITGAAVQYLAYKTAVICGNDPDKPRNLAKSVTVE